MDMDNLIASATRLREEQASYVPPG
jgi:hypothetical protein